MSTKTITVTESNPIDLDRRHQALSKINEIDTDTLVKLASMTGSKKALDYIQNKWMSVKMFLGVK